jgi:hypothetical protein
MANGDVRIATTAALGAGTKVLDGVAVANIVGNTAAATGTTQIIPPGTILWARDTGEEFPFVFAQNEGFVIRSVAVPGTGTWQFSVIVEWSEIDPSVDSSWA